MHFSQFLKQKYNLYQSSEYKKVCVKQLQAQKGENS